MDTRGEMEISDAYLLSRNVLNMFVAHEDVHESQIRFALEHGVLTMVTKFATFQLLYPSQAFDLFHCSRYKINWTCDGKILLLVIHRKLRAGRYLAWVAPSMYKHEETQEEHWKSILTPMMPF